MSPTLQAETDNPKSAIFNLQSHGGPMKPTVRVDFDKHLQDWDGFGVNYVEAAQTRDYNKDPQDYGGFSTLDEAKRQEIIDLTFGPDGLRPGLLKMFLDSFHQDAPGKDPYLIDHGEYDHCRTTEWMRYYAREGLKKTREWGGDLSVLTDLYGPPGFMTQQKIVRGRDLDPDMQLELAKYVCAFAKYLRDEEDLPVHYVGCHNEGEDWVRWPDDGRDTPNHQNHDYNMYWTPEAVAEILPLVREVLDKNGMQDVGVTPGETSNWTRFHAWGYADAIADNAAAMDALGLITSHGFAGFNMGRWFGDWRSAGIDTIREKKSSLHAWVTSTSWAKMDAFFAWEAFGSIYAAKVNGIIPWAAVQNPPLWVGGDPNPGNAFQVDGAGNYEVRQGYYFYKPLCRAGQPGMKIAKVRSNDGGVCPIGFASNGTDNGDNVVLINIADTPASINLELNGTSHDTFDTYRTSPTENYVSLGETRVGGGATVMDVPAGSVVVMFGK